MTVDDNIRESLIALFNEDRDEFYRQMNEAFVAMVEAGTQRRANELGFFFQPGVTFSDELGESEALYDLAGDEVREEEFNRETLEDKIERLRKLQ